MQLFVRSSGIFAVLLAAGLTALGPSMALAQAFPSKSIKIVQGFAAGGQADTLARILGQGLQEEIGQPVIVEGRTGAGGNIASEYVAKAPADGYTLILQTNGHAVSAAIYKTLPYDPLRDFRWLSLTTGFVFVVGTRPDSKINSLQELIKTARSEPGKLSFSSVGVGTTQHLIGELLQSTARVKMLHVPYRGGGAPVGDVIAGRVDILFDTYTVARGHLQGGKLRALAVTSSKRIAQLPDVPAVAETVPGFEVTSWMAVAGPAGLKSDVVDKLHRALVKGSFRPEIRKRLAELGGIPTSNTPEQTAKHVGAQIDKWKRVVEGANIPRR
jgi:tripartite-type tricarboxylate transporter receptor subunit TctC